METNIERRKGIELSAQVSRLRQLIYCILRWFTDENETSSSEKILKPKRMQTRRPLVSPKLRLTKTSASQKKNYFRDWRCHYFSHARWEGLLGNGYQPR